MPARFEVHSWNRLDRAVWSSRRDTLFTGRRAHSRTLLERPRTDGFDRHHQRSATGTLRTVDVDRARAATRRPHAGLNHAAPRAARFGP